MATEVRSFDITIPAGTPVATPVTVDVSFPSMVTEVVEWHVPKGPSGLMGWRLTSGGGQVIPKNLNSWIVADGQGGNWTLEDLHTSGAWQVTGYNTGSFPHIVRIRFHTSPVEPKQPPAGALAWLLAGKYTAQLVELGNMANAAATVDVPRSVLWPPRR